jgi:alpha-beta hydrolase superfamily lysophospholipase
MRIEAALLGAAHRSALAEALSFRAFNRRFRPNRTTADWLTRDTAEVDAYLADPLCGQRCSAGLWRALLSAGAGLTAAAALQPVPETLPILLITGARDAVNQDGRGAAQLADAYRRRGLQDVELKTYAEARHELLNERNRDEVTEDVSRWLRAKSAPLDRF